MKASDPMTSPKPANRRTTSLVNVLDEGRGAVPATT